MVWSSNSQSFTTYSAAQANRPDTVQVWNTDGSLAATASSTAGLTPEVALSGDGNTLAMTGNVPNGAGNVSAWSVSSQQPAAVGDPPGRHPALSGNGAVMAWLEPFGAKAIDISTGPGQRRRVAVPFVPVGVAVSADGSLVAALVDRYGDDYSIVPIDVATGKVGAARAVGNFATTSSNPWSNPPRTVPTESADPPAVSFGPSGSTVWVSNNQYHVGVELARTASAPTAWVRYHRQVTTQLSGGDLIGLRTTTPDGHTAVFYNANTATYQVFIWSSGWKTAGAVPIQLCSANPCNFSISPDGSELAVASVSALQIIDIRSPASTSSAIIGSQGAIPSGSSVVMGPAGGTALSWSAGSLALIDEATGTERRLAVPLGAGENFDAVGFNPGGSRAIAVIGRGDGCPCRVVTLDAATGNVLGSAALGGSALSRVPHDTPVAVTLNDAADIVAVTYDTNAHGSSGPHRCALATYSLAGGQPLQVITNASIGLGEHDVSVPAFQPGTDAVSLVATQGSSHEVAGVMLDARSGVTLHTLSMSSGAVTLYPDDFGNDGYALRFSPNGQLLAWNTEGSVVIWDLGAAAGSQNVQTDVVLTSASFVRSDRARDLRQRRGRDRRPQLLHVHRRARHRRRDDRRRVGPVAPAAGDRADRATGPAGRPDLRGHARRGSDRRGRARHERIPFLHRHLGRDTVHTARRAVRRVVAGDDRRRVADLLPGRALRPGLLAEPGRDVVEHQRRAAAGVGPDREPGRAAGSSNRAGASSRVGPPSCRSTAPPIHPPASVHRRGQSPFAWRSRYIRKDP